MIRTGLGYEWGYGEMAQGLQVFSEEGHTRVDLSSKLTKVLGVMTLVGDGELTFEQYPNNEPWYVVTKVPQSEDRNILPLIRKDGRRIFWKNIPAYSPGGIAYGVY